MTSVTQVLHGSLQVQQINVERFLEESLPHHSVGLSSEHPEAKQDDNCLDNNLESSPAPVVEEENVPDVEKTVSIEDVDKPSLQPLTNVDLTSVSEDFSQLFTDCTSIFRKRFQDLATITIIEAEHFLFKILQVDIVDVLGQKLKMLVILLVFFSQLVINLLN